MMIGIGDVDSILELYKLGIDTFDSAYPTKVARHGQCYSRLVLPLLSTTIASAFNMMGVSQLEDIGSPVL